MESEGVASMSLCDKELVFLILQFLDEKKFNGVVHKLEQESGVYFNMHYFEDRVRNGDWDEVENYMSGFTKYDDNNYSRAIIFQIRKQKYLEALDRKDPDKACDILIMDLKILLDSNEDLYKELTQLLGLENFRENELLSGYEDTESSRGVVFAEIKRLIEKNPVFHDKLNFPSFKGRRLNTLLSQSLKWQHQLCKSLNHKPGILTLFVDHLCVTDTLVCAVPPSHSNGPRALSSVINPLLNCVPASHSNGAGAPSNTMGVPFLRAHAAFQQDPGSPSLDKWMTNPSSVPHPSASAGSIGFNIQDCSDILTHLRMPMNNPAEDYQNDDPEQVLERTRPLRRSNEFPLISMFADVNDTMSSIEDRVSPATSTVSMHEDSQSLVDWKSKVADESSDKSVIWKLKEVNDPSSCRSLRLPDSLASTRVSRLMYANSGNAIMSLYANAVHKLWKWPKNECNPTGEARTNTVPQLWQPRSGISVTNYISLINPEDAVPCFALSKNDSYVISTSGGGISLFNTMTFQTMATFMPPPPAATFLAFHPQDNNIIAIGMDDSSILIYYVRLDKVQTKLDAHQKRITGLAFSNIYNVLVSAGADSQLCVWSIDTWEKQTSKYLQSPPGCLAASLADTHVQFHQDQTHLLAFQERQITIYEVPNLTCLMQYAPLQASGGITCATYSCDGQSIYISFENGSIGVFIASSLCLRCRINYHAYAPAYPSVSAYPLVIAAHPHKPNQFALGLTDGEVCVIEPLESEGEWGTLPPQETSAGPSTGHAASSDQPQR